MYLKVILNIFFIILLSLIQVGFINGLPLMLSNINLLLIVLIYVLVLGGFRMAGVWALSMGLILDIISFLPFGAFLISFFLSLIVINFLLVNFFTNRSLYAYIAITFFASISFFISIYVFSVANQIYKLNGELDLFNLVFWQNALMQIVINILVVFFTFYIINFLSNNLKPVFLVKKKI